MEKWETHLLCPYRGTECFAFTRRKQKGEAAWGYYANKKDVTTVSCAYHNQFQRIIKFRHS